MPWPGSSKHSVLRLTKANHAMVTLSLIGYGYIVPPDYDFEWLHCPLREARQADTFEGCTDGQISEVLSIFDFS